MEISRYRKPELNIVGLVGHEELEDFSMYSELSDYLYQTFIDGEFTFDTDNEIKHSKMILFDRGTWYFVDTNKRVIKVTKDNLEPTNFNTWIKDETVFNYMEEYRDFICEISISDLAKENIDIWGNDFLNSGGSSYQKLAEENKNLEYIR